MSKTKVKKPFYKKWWFWVIVVIVILGMTNTINDEIDEDLAQDEVSEDQAEDQDEGHTEEEKEAEEEHENEEEAKAKSEIPEISEDAMNHAYDIINGYEMVKDSHIEVSTEGQKITLAIVVNAATNEDHAKDLGDNFARALATGVAIYSEDELESPSKDYLGELYDFYDLHVGVGTGPDHFIAQGAMVTSASKITW